MINAMPRELWNERLNTLSTLTQVGAVGKISGLQAVDVGGGARI